MRSILKHKMKFSLKVGCPANGLPACCLLPERVRGLLAAFVVMLNFAPTFGLAQESGLRFSHFTTSDGLSDNYATSVIQEEYTDFLRKFAIEYNINYLFDWID